MCETKNENSSNLLRGISENGGILFYGIDSTAIVRRMEQLHKTSAVTTAALGRLLTGVAMMGQMLKSDSDSVTVQIKGGGHDLVAAPPVGQGKNQFKICFRHGRLTPLHGFSIHPLAEPAGGPGVDAGQGPEHTL